MQSPLENWKQSRYPGKVWDLQGGVRVEEIGEGGEKGRIVESLAEWDGRDGGRVYVEAGKEISIIKWPFWDWQGTRLQRGSQQSTGMTPAMILGSGGEGSCIVFVYHQTNDYLEKNNRNLVQGWVETVTENHIGTLD